MLQAAKFINMPQHLAYYRHLDRPDVIDAARYRFRRQSIIYGLRCRATNQVYIGNSLNPVKRFHNHLVSGQFSNVNLQHAITKYGLSYFTLYIFEVVHFPDRDMDYAARKSYLATQEQRYINMFPKLQLYNTINSSITQ